MKITHILAVCAIAMAVVSCSPKLEKGELISDKKINDLCSDSTTEGKRLAIEGYVHIGSDMHSVQVGEPESISFCSEPEGKGSYLGWLYLNYGSSKNSFTVPDQFDDTDIKLYDNEGTLLKYNDKVMVSFTVTKGFRKKYDSDQGKWVETDIVDCEYENVRVDKL